MISIRIRHLSSGGREAGTKRHPYWLRSSDAREHKLRNIGKLRRVLGFPPYTSANAAVTRLSIDGQDLLPALPIKEHAAGGLGLPSAKFCVSPMEQCSKWEDHQVVMKI